MKKALGYLTLVFSCLVTFNLWILAKGSGASFLGTNYLTSLAQIFSLIGFVLMSESLFLSTKFSFLEDIFGGMDRNYSVHKVLGTISFVLLVNHPILLALSNSATKLSKIYFLPVGVLSYNLGVFALYIMISSLALMVYIKLPYHIWKLSHQLMGVGFVLGSLHILLIGSDISSYPLLKDWILLFMVVGVFSFLYSVFFYTFFGPKHIYEVETIERDLDIVNIYLKALTKRLKFSAGQFIYISVRDRSSVGKEMHPFTISSAPEDDLLRISAKMLGDYTLKTPGLLPGDEVYVYGPYGRFGQNFVNKKRLFWIAGGIGVTPFLSMLRHIRQVSDMREVTFYYCVRDSRYIPFKSEIEMLAQVLPNLKVVFWSSFGGSRLTASDILSSAPATPDIAVELCGPVPMMRDLKNQLIKKGVSENAIATEEFGFI